MTYKVTDGYSLNTFVVRAENDVEAMRKVHKYQFTGDFQSYFDTYKPKAERVDNEEVVEVIQYS